MVGVAVKVTEVPAQIVVADALMETEGVRLAVTVMVTWSDAVVGLAQGSLLVKITFTTSLLARVDELNVLLLVPTLEPFTCH